MSRVVTILLFLLAGAAAAGDLAATRDWLVRSLEAGLEVRIPDLNRVASVVYPLSHDLQRHPDPALRRVLEQVGERLRGLDVGSLDCGALVDYHLTAGFLRPLGIQVPLRRVRARLAGCDLSGSRFDEANALLFYCRYSPWSHEKRLPGGLRRLIGYQREDGAFTLEDGRPWYYLTSHALLALYFCHGDPGAVRKAQQRLIRLLPRFREKGFLDGLVENLIFLRWTGTRIPHLAAYVEYLRSRRRGDGGLCFVDRPGCRPHWHATSLWLEWLLLQKEGRGEPRERAG